MGALEQRPEQLDGRSKAGSMRRHLTEATAEAGSGDLRPQLGDFLAHQAACAAAGDGDKSIRSQQRRRLLELGHGGGVATPGRLRGTGHFKLRPRRSWQVAEPGRPAPGRRRLVTRPRQLGGGASRRFRRFEVRLQPHDGSDKGVRKSAMDAEMQRFGAGPRRLMEAVGVAVEGAPAEHSCSGDGLLPR
ncbi:hypothetical protein TRIUR3_30628 [Triticum urartu]|uniref:Uncharacterized protein n=1 Tax=Triticum urartu TaxID=4572 RepID=M7ZKJ6_TRIUA|nr:hypothetical protein TRIUR3_30628 [Triticum urartu]